MAFDRLRRRLARLADWITDGRCLALGGTGAVVCGIVAGLILAYGPDPSVVRQLERYRPSVVTVLYDDDGEPFAEWFLERRQLVSYAEIPQVLRNAVLAAEDAAFFHHVGVDPVAVVRAAISNVLHGYGSQGAGTMTMQLSRNLWLEPDKRMARKIKEAIFAIQIERNYSKERIFELYANQIFLGNENARIHGLQTAADYYLGKPVQDVTLAEAALLAGMIQRPAGYNPYRNPEGAVARRNVILDRMVEEGFIDPEEARQAKAEPLRLGTAVEKNTVARYFTEEIRKDLIQDFGYDAIYKSGLRVDTTLDRELQVAAEEALDRGLREVDKRQGWRGARRNLPAEGIDPDFFEHPDWRFPPTEGDILPAVVVTLGAERVRVRIGEQTAVLEADDAEWTDRDDLSGMFHVGDLISVRIESVAEDGTLELELDQEPRIEGAVLVIENFSGEVKAMVGGREFDDSEFNRSIQAVRQTGSIFKPFVYTTALREGLTPADLLLDQPTRFEDPTTHQPYSPRNYGDEYTGVTTLAEALMRSRNVCSVKVQQRVGADDVIETARSMGLTAPLQPYLSLALGVIDVSLWEITRAYAVFPNRGVLVEPHMIRGVTDAMGRVLQKGERKAEQVLDSDIAYLMIRMLRNVVEHGTAVRARALARELELPLAGKTGTTDDYSDAWFVGFSPDYTVGVWVGYDEKIKIGRNETGSRAALPVWLDVMRAASRDSEPRRFEQPESVVIRTIDRHTGLLASDICGETVDVAFLEGTEPTGVCTAEHHRITALPYHLQAYFLEDGRLRTSVTAPAEGR